MPDSKNPQVRTFQSDLSGYKHNGFIAHNTQRLSSEYVGQETGNIRSRNGMRIMNWQTEPAPKWFRCMEMEPIPHHKNWIQKISSRKCFWEQQELHQAEQRACGGCIGMENGVRPRTGIKIPHSLSVGGRDWGLDDWEAQCREMPERT